MGKKKVISAIVFVAIAMVSGSMASVCEMKKGSVDVRGATQVEAVNTVQVENKKMAHAENVTFSCGVPGCTLTEEHQHGLCGIDGCMEIGEHSHGEHHGGHYQSGHRNGHH